MVKQLDSASNSNNKITANINRKGVAITGTSGVASNSYSSPTANAQSVMDLVTVQAMSKSPVYIQTQKTNKVSWWKRLGLGTKATILAVALGVLPVFSIGIVDYFLVKQAFNSEISNRSVRRSHPRDTDLSAPDLTLLLWGTGVTAVLAGIAGGVLAKRAIKPVLSSTEAVKKLGLGEFNIRLNVEGEDELAVLGSNINWMADQFQTLLEDQKASLEQLQVYADTVNAASIGDKQFIFDRVVREALNQLNVDRVIVYGLEFDWSGTIVAEAVESGWPRALSDKITDPCIPRKFLEEYQRGRIVPTSNVQNTNYSPAHLELLARLQVKANLVVPIVSGDVLVGLLIAHQCSGIRDWQQSEIDFLKELAAQVGVSLSSLTLATQKAAVAEQIQRWKDVTLRIRSSLNFDEILKTTVAELRNALKLDRAVICRFDSYNHGTITAESVAPGWLKTLSKTLDAPLLEGDTQKLPRRETLRTVDNIKHANLADWEYTIMEQLQVKGYMMAPIIRGDKVYGWLCAHSLAKPRIWLDAEINLFTEVASQLGLALDQADLLKQQAVAVEQAQKLNQITLRMRKSLLQQEIFSAAVNGTREALGADRTVVCLLDEKSHGTFVAESLAEGCKSALGEKISDQCFADEYVEKYRRGRIQALSDIHSSGLSQCHLDLLEPFKIKANLVVPILVEDQLIGLLSAHQCTAPRTWQEIEINFFQQVAIQMGFALEQASLLNKQALATEQAQQLNEITNGIRESLKIEDIYHTAITGVRETLKTDRALVYLFDDNWQGTIVAEAVGREWPKSLGANIADPCFADRYVEKYQRGRVKAIENIYNAGLTQCYLSQLEPFKVQANLVAPILSEGKLLGLLVTHQCSSTRRWQESEINFFKQIATQIGFALEQVTLLTSREQALINAEAVSQEQRQQKEALQLQLLELLSDVEGAARGDLTVRADVTAGEIGTVADFFNAVIESLRGIVTQVKDAATQVNTSLSLNEEAIQQLSFDALKQAEETTRTLDSVEQMTRSIQEVAENASLAAGVAHTASTTAQTGGRAMERSVENILSLRTTVAQTAKKVKRLGESSQQISKVVSLINQIALQTNLLAINAGIEAARAGEEGQGFAVVAEEVGELAARSAAATKEIEQIVENIQQETVEVVEAMELGTTQVVEGTHLVEDAKQSLSQIVEVSKQIDQLVQSIKNATVSGAQTSETVTELMKDIAKVSERTSNSTRAISRSLQETVGIAQELQASVGTFNVGE
ncbi:MAG: GAF domain-containing protein [Symploca sp. SIO1B1]|nr:GAF domain-containing protein [Symploca sp. SIO1C2]NER96308.1 GAF domain-containing protein [Symploca sp. SIO1B1]